MKLRQSNKDLYVFNETLYCLFIYIVKNNDSFSNELSIRLETLEKFFITYKYPKLEEFAHNIENHTGEDGPCDAIRFMRNSYEMFLKETDEELYSLFRRAEDLYRDQAGIKEILDGKEIPEPVKREDDHLPF